MSRALSILETVAFCIVWYVLLTLALGYDAR